MKRTPLGQILIEMGVLDPDQLQSALAHQRQWGTPLARAILEKGFCTEQQVMAGLSKQLGLESMDLDGEELTPSLCRLMPLKAAEQHKAVPLRTEGKRQEVLVIAIAAPASMSSLDAIQAVSGKQRLISYLATDDAIGRAIDRLYRGISTSVPARRLEGDAAAAMQVAELELGPAGPAPARLEAPGVLGTTATMRQATENFAGLSLSDLCASALNAAAHQHGVPVSEIMAKVLESWARAKKG